MRGIFFNFILKPFLHLRAGLYLVNTLPDKKEKIFEIMMEENNDGLDSTILLSD